MTEPHVSQVPVCVDLDGTLITGDLLWEALFLLLGQQPILVWQIPFWLLRGKAAFKEEVANHIKIQADTLPYHPELLEFLRELRRDGRRLILATASDRRFAQAVADHLELFDDVIATEAGLNCAGAGKLSRIQKVCRGRFDYIGNSSADLPLWEAANESYVVNASSSVLSKARNVCQPIRVFPRKAGGFRAMIRLLRPVQWAKNLLLFVPLLMAHELDFDKWLTVLIAFLGLSACASGTYIINDLTDINSDRRHPRKYRRPLAAGTVSIPAALVMSGGLMLGAVGLTAICAPVVLPCLLVGYILATLTYSYVLKNKLFVDVLMLAGLYTYRILAGGLVAGISLSHWLLAFSVFLFLSLALSKRFTELSAARGEVNSRRGYRPEDLDLLGNLGPTCGYLACLVFLLYIAGDTATTLYSRPTFLWFVGPLFLYWITRIWFLAHRGELSDDPLVFAVKDRHTYVIGLMTAVLVLLAV